MNRIGFCVFILVSLLGLGYAQEQPAIHSSSTIGNWDARFQEEKAALQAILESLRPAILDLSNTFGERYPNGSQLIAQLTELDKRFSTISMDAVQSFKSELLSLQHEALIENPLISERPILFVTRPQYLPDHHSTETMFQTGEINTESFRGGSALKTLDLPSGEVKTLIDSPNGIVRDPEIHSDGKRIIFSRRQDKSDDYHIYEFNLENQNVRQLTFGGGLTDIDPAFLPNGDIVFISTREPKYCQCNRHIMGNLFTMSADGQNILQIGRNILFEGHPTVLPDGRILYDRWEYVDKHFGPAFGLWTCNPDGTNHAMYYGNNAWAPGAIVDARPIPGTEWVVATFGSCHDRPWGAIAIVDRRLGLDGTEPVVHCWPADMKSRLTDNRQYGNGAERNHPMGGQIDNFVSMPVKYEDPFPLSKNYFLCSRQIEKERMGLFLLDVFGNEMCLHEEESGCYDPMPIQPRECPPVIPSRVDLSKTEGIFYVANVYEGTGMERVQPGAVKTLRVIEAPAKLYWTQTNWNLDATQAPAMNFNSTNNKRILGEVPVETDGSAYFTVPSDTFVFFQLLDENGMMVQSMRSGTMVRPGEILSCVGCHEDRLMTFQASKTSMALRRDPSPLKSWYGPPREFNYLTEVQPVFDKNCVSCHDYSQPAGDTLNLSGDLGLAFNTSYLELRTKSALRWYSDSEGSPKILVKAVDDGPPEVLPAYSWGSHRSRLVEVLRNGHQDIQLDREGFDRIVTWIDMNAPYYGSYASNYPSNVFGRSPLDDRQIEELRKLTGVQVGDMGTELQGSQCNFTRPEWSPCLQGLAEKNPGNYKNALAILQEGKAMLEKKPRMDMPGAALLEADCAKLAKYNARVDEEKNARRNLARKKNNE